MSDSGHGHENISCMIYKSFHVLIVNCMECGCRFVPLLEHFSWGVALVGEFNY